MSSWGVLDRSKDMLVKTVLLIKHAMDRVFPLVCLSVV